MIILPRLSRFVDKIESSFSAQLKPNYPESTVIVLDCLISEYLKLEGGGKTMEDLEGMALDRSKWRLWTASHTRARKIY